MEWSQEHVSKAMKERADHHFTYMRDIAPDARAGNTASQFKHDQDLAAWLVLDSLWGKTFLKTREEFILHLKMMVDTPRPADNAFDQDAFHAHYRAVIQLLITEFAD